MEMPFARSTQIVQSLLMQQAYQAGVKVVLNGHGADEMLAGYPDRYCALVAADAFLKFNWIRGLTEIRAMARDHGINGSKTAFASLGILQPALASFLKESLRPKHKDLFRADLKQTYPSNHWMIRDKATLGKTALHRRLQQEYFWELVPVWLCMEDKVSMSASIESRLPFLDYRLVEFVFSLDDAEKIGNGVTKYILREAMRVRLPESIVAEKKKLSFSGPTDHWLRNAFKSTIQTTLLEGTPRIAEFVNFPELRRRLSDFLDHGRGDSRVIWKIFNTEIWMRTFFQR